MSASKPSSQHTEPEMQDRTSQSGLQHRLSLEIWETILFHLQDEDLENVAAASSYLSVAAVRPRCYRLRWVNMNHFTQFQQDTADDSLCWVTVSVTLGRGRYRDGINTPKLDFSVVLPTIVSFSNLTTLKAFAIWFPLHDVLSIVHQLPKLEHLGLYAIRRTWDARREATVPSRPYRTALKTIEFTNVPGHALKEDEGFHDLVSLLCFSAIRHFRTTMGTFIDILAFALDDDIRTFAVHFASTLEVLDVRTYLDEPVDPSCLDCDDYSDAITHIIQNCAPSLRRFWIWSTSPCPTPEATIHLPSAVDVIGPQDLLLGFTFGERISCIWVPSPSPSSRSPWKVSLGIPDCAETATLTKLSLSRWAASDMPVEKIFASYPELSELSIEPSSPMSKVSHDKTIMDFR
ncbi:hypothetical protein V5O48_015440 [Marasmius crinis-equi]|uniref:F-box domain-containing protein n=1 Tax=Marasmius crinis-equi TaxID=585013 RepID=A0ABR3EUL1_9AGAR